RKIPFDKCVNQNYVNRLKPATVSASRDIHEIVFRAQIFINYYITRRSQRPQDNDIPHCIFRQEFWYSVCQMINSKRATTSTNIPADMLEIWDIFRSEHTNIVYDKTMEVGDSQCLSEACTELATSYQNNVVENFGARLYYLLQNTFYVSNKI
ncbi:hypothetical protein EDC94DRAFT_526896, partial [Helicostylum pulchrum]